MTLLTKIIATGALTLTLATCGGSSDLGADATTQRSTDPTIRSFVDAFTNVCINSVPQFDQGRIHAALSSYQLPVPAGATFIATGEAGRKCRFYVRGYGSNRAHPTHGDLLVMAKALKSRLGGTIRPPSHGNILVRTNAGKYSIFAYVNPKGDLTISIFE